MSEAPKREVIEKMDELTDALNTLADDEAIQDLQKPLLQRVPGRVRSGVYEAGKWLGLAGAAGLSIAGVIGGEGERFIEAAGLLVLAVSNWIAKANLSD